VINIDLIPNFLKLLEILKLQIIKAPSEDKWKTRCKLKNIHQERKE
jgi:hypothetical protein